MKDSYRLPNALMDEMERMRTHIKELESQLSDGKVAIDIISKLNAILVVKYGNIFNIDDKAPSWDWTIEKLDEILTQLNSMLSGMMIR